jgi:hypothetical protein
MNGDPRSLTKTKGDVGLSRYSRRSARSAPEMRQHRFYGPFVGLFEG